MEDDYLGMVLICQSCGWISDAYTPDEEAEIWEDSSHGCDECGSRNREVTEFD